MGTKLKKTKTSYELAEFKLIMQTLKKIIKERKLSYRDLAVKLGISESGVKKIFTGQDCSYGRLVQITRVLGFRMIDLLEKIEGTEMKGFTFSKEQQEFFLKNMDVFSFFVKLVVERESLTEIKKEFQLSDKATFNLLKKLDQLNLIQLHPGDRVKLPPLYYVRDFGPGPLLSKVYRQWGEAIVRDLADPQFQSSGQFIIRCFKMRDETYQELLTRLLDLEREFLQRAVREMSTSASKLKSLRWVSLTDQQSFIKGKL
ncbi:MAG: helix-turn-helix transcriptional regulator [Oligoflexia bacterium]|nr:helix-turn-helix transcriptional regulator [Oligoflexia bacterium]